LGRSFEQAEKLIVHGANGKTVYILGAGFSRDAGFPLQSEILERIRRFDIDILRSKVNREFLDVSEVFLPQEEKESLKEFLNKVFSASLNLSLEEIFTLLDETISRKGFCLGYTWLDLYQIREILKRAILIVFHDTAEQFKKM